MSLLAEAKWDDLDLDPGPRFRLKFDLTKRVELRIKELDRSRSTRDDKIKHISRSISDRLDFWRDFSHFVLGL